MTPIDWVAVLGVTYLFALLFALRPRKVIPPQWHQPWGGYLVSVSDIPTAEPMTYARLMSLIPEFGTVGFPYRSHSSPWWKRCDLFGHANFYARVSDIDSINRFIVYEDYRCGFCHRELGGSED